MGTVNCPTEHINKYTSNACKQNKENRCKEPNTHWDMVVMKERGHQEHREDSCQRAMHHLHRMEVIYSRDNCSQKMQDTPPLQGTTTHGNTYPTNDICNCSSLSRGKAWSSAVMSGRQRVRTPGAVPNHKFCIHMSLASRTICWWTVLILALQTHWPPTSNPQNGSTRKTSRLFVGKYPPCVYPLST